MSDYVIGRVLDILGVCAMLLTLYLYGGRR